MIWERVPRVARRMVTEFGMSARLGPVALCPQPDGHVLQGMTEGGVTWSRDYRLH
jgi:ATP-dependent Zn protease